ncbi:hypothetical protein LWI29_007464 [Acer saccharum]|uniref:Myb/SANT-like DNA-binding domain-containing protein n=1 Tax=Acer saccharum TaxID=4024 RepID=A0AA39SJM1_ACESA|nr:hypothetical protein LWI29_007464 [Acer saccharum]KAK1575782.1 hypothetical protein Q3G72_008253 [Acer saccharum]
MDEDDEIQSHPSPTATGSPTGSPTASGSPENGRITVTVAAAAPSLHQPPPQSPQQQQNNCMTVALVPQQQRNGSGGGGGGGGSGGGGREDCWSEGATAVLIEAWGERYMELSRGNLKQKHWKEVADIVSSREDHRKTPKTDIQCKNRIDTVKKKYKLEKAKMMSGGGSSKWVFFEKLDQLIGPTAKIPVVAAGAVGTGGSSSRVPMGIPVGMRNQIVVAKNQHHHQGGGGSGSSSGQKIQLRRRGGGAAAMVAAVESEEEESDEESRDSMDSFPPPAKRGRVAVVMGDSSKGKKEKEKEKEKSGSGGWGDSVRMLTQAIMKFGEAYEQAESAKIQQVVEMEKQRMKFAKELELQRMQFFMKTQMEISQLKHGRRTSGNASNHHRHHRSNDNGNNNNNSDSDN